MSTGNRVLNGIAVLGIAGIVGVIGVVAHGEDTWRTEPTPKSTITLTYPSVTTEPTPAPETETITEGDPAWNCLTMGNRQCGPGWVPIPEDLYDGLGVSDDEQCVWNVGDTTTIACSDDQVFQS